VQGAWDDAAPGSKSGSKACPTCGKDADVAPGDGRRDWEVDHQPKWKDRDLTGKTRQEVLDGYNEDVRLRCPSCKRSDNQWMPPSTWSGTLARWREGGPPVPFPEFRSVFFAISHPKGS